MEQLQLVIQQATKDFKEEMAQIVQSLMEQISCLIKSQTPRPLAYHE